MVTSKQRQRQLARARWERQQERRAKMAHRRRVISVVVGVIVGLVVVALLVWLVLYIIDEEKSRNQTPVVPTDSFSTELKTPTPATPTQQGTEPTKGKATPKNTTSNSDGPGSTKSTKTGGNR